jgi:hypothetical protein
MIINQYQIVKTVNNSKFCKGYIETLNDAELEMIKASLKTVIYDLEKYSDSDPDEIGKYKNILEKLQRLEI